MTFISEIKIIKIIGDCRMYTRHPSPLFPACALWSMMTGVPKTCTVSSFHVRAREYVTRWGLNHGERGSVCFDFSLQLEKILSILMLEGWYSQPHASNHEAEREINADVQLIFSSLFFPANRSPSDDVTQIQSGFSVLRLFWKCTQRYT